MGEFFGEGLQFVAAEDKSRESGELTQLGGETNQLITTKIQVDQSEINETAEYE